MTYPTDTKLGRRIIARCWKVADRHGVRRRRRYTKLVRQSLLAQRWRQQSEAAQGSAPRSAKAAHHSPVVWGVS